MAHPVIIFEGLDHTGKTTTATRLVTEVGGVYLHSPPEELMLFRKEFDKMGPLPNLEFYLTCNRIIDIKIREAQEHKPVVVDRHFFSTIAYHSNILGMDLDGVIATMLTLPDRVYYLTAELEEIEMRTARTGQINPRFHGKGLWAKADATYRRLLEGYPVLEIDTTHIDEAAVYRLVLEDFIRIRKKVLV
ncbi:MAG: AAA family ATPase [Nanoarchaeota archaeon]|nr:AAA family ATPase [Nanoarchaeota archaeon]